MPRDTGLLHADVRDDFVRARRRQAMRALARRLSRDGGDVDVILPFHEVVAELGQTGAHDLGYQVVPLDTIVGTVDRGKEFDRSFLPTSPQVRDRWQAIARLMRRGDPVPPVSLYRVGEVHFVRDGHHRVSVARALGRRDIDAYVTEIRTRVGADRSLRPSELPRKGHERLFRERVPLPPDRATHVQLTDPWRYGALAESVEAWAYRRSQASGEVLDRRTAAHRWYEDEFAPVTAMLREAGLKLAGETDADAYLRVGEQRYRLMRTMSWDEDIVKRALRR